MTCSWAPVQLGRTDLARRAASRSETEPPSNAGLHREVPVEGLRMDTSGLDAQEGGAGVPDEGYAPRDAYPHEHWQLEGLSEPLLRRYHADEGIDGDGQRTASEDIHLHVGSHQPDPQVHALPDPRARQDGRDGRQPALGVTVRPRAA